MSSDAFLLPESPSFMRHQTKQQPKNECVPQVNCIYHKLPTLRKLKKGKLKPASKQRTIYLKTMGRFGNILHQFAALLAIKRVTCSKVKVSSEHKLHEIFEDFPFEVISKAKFKR